MKEPPADRFTSVYGNDRGAAVRVSEEVMTSLRANDLEASALENGEDLFACRSREPCHSATVTR